MDEANILTYDIYEVYNPLDRDFTTLWGKKPYTIRAKGYLLLPKFLAEKLAYELAEQEVQRGKGGISAVLNKTLMAQETAKLLKLTQTATANPVETNAFERQISQLNNASFDRTNVDPNSLGSVIEPDDEERQSTKDNFNPNATLVEDLGVTDTTTEPEDFADIVDEKSEVREAVKENLMLQTKADLLAMAEKEKIDVNPRSNKETIVEAILENK